MWIGNAYKMGYCLLVLEGATFSSTGNVTLDSGQGVQILGQADSGDNQRGGLLDNGEPIWHNVGFPMLPHSVISAIANIPLFTGLQYSDVFKKISMASSVATEDVEKLKEVLLGLEDQQFFDFCMQQSYFPGSISELRGFFGKLDIYNSCIFNAHRNRIFEFEQYRKDISEQFERS